MPEVNLDHARAIGEKLRMVRRQRRMSLRELAQRAEVSASMLSQIETGKAYPSVRSIYNIAAALSVPVDYFFPERGSKDFIPLDEELDSAGDMTASEMREVHVGQAADVAAVELSAHGHSPMSVVHVEARPTIELKGGVTWARLTAMAEPDAEFLEITYEPGATSGANMSHHQGREFGLILEGELVVELGFDVYALRSGDSIVFDSSTPHRLINQGLLPMRALWVVLNRSQ